MIGHRSFVCAGVLALTTALSAVAPVAAQEACDSDTNYASRASASLAEGQFSSAFEAYTCLIEEDSQNYEAYLGRAIASIQQAALDNEFRLNINRDLNAVWNGNPALIEAAIDDAEEAVRADAGDLGALAVRAYLNGYLGSYQAAIADYNTILQDHPGNVFATLFRGSVNLYMGNTAKASADFRRASEAAPENAAVQAYIGLAYYNTEDPEPGIGYFDQAIELEPENGLYYSYRGYAYQQLEDYDAALSDFNHAVELEPENADPYVDRAFLYQVMEDLESAIEDFTRAIEIDPNYQYAYQSRGWAYVDSGAYDAAIEDFDAALDLDNTDRWSFLGRATAQLEQGDIAGSAQDYAAYVDLTEAFRFDGPNLHYGEDENISMSEGNVFYLPLQAQAGDALTITAASNTGEVDPLLLLLDPDGMPVAGNDDMDAAHENYNAQITNYEVPESGAYTVVVTHAGGGSTGVITVSVEAGKKL